MPRGGLGGVPRCVASRGAAGSCLSVAVVGHGDKLLGRSLQTPQVGIVSDKEIEKHESEPLFRRTHCRVH